MRILESLKIPYTHHTYECEEFVDGLQIADKLSLPYEQVYKTLVTVSNSKNYFVFVIPIAAELDLRRQDRISDPSDTGGSGQGSESRICRYYPA